MRADDGTAQLVTNGLLSTTLLSARDGHCLPDLAMQSHLFLGSDPGHLVCLSPFKLLKSHILS